MKSISIVFPAYNEEDNITFAVQQAKKVVSRVTRTWEIIVVNDGSRDKTGEIIDKMSHRDNRIRPIHHPTNSGYGAALKSGITSARHGLIFFCDSDLQFDLQELPTFIRLIEDCDLVIGYRARRQDPFHRKLNAWGWNVLIRLYLGLKVRDIDCAFKLFRREVFDTIKIDAIGAMVNTDILVQAQRYGFSIKEMPVTHYPRRNGKQTGANVRVILKAFRELFRLHTKLNSANCDLAVKYPARTAAEKAFLTATDKKISRQQMMNS